MGDILLQDFVNVRLWDLAQWRATAFLIDPLGAEIPGLGFVFNKVAIGKHIFSRLLGYLGKLDKFEELRLSIIEGEIPGLGPGYSVHLSSEPEHTKKRAEAEGWTFDSNLAVVGSRINRMTPKPDSPWLVAFKDAVRKHGRYFLLPVGMTDQNEMEPWFQYAIEKTEIFFKRISEIGEDDREAAIRGERDSKTWIRVEDDLSSNLRKLRESKSRSLLDIQSYYFDILQRFVGQMHSEMIRAGVTPHDIALDATSNPKFVRECMPAQEDYVLLVREFWESFAPVVRENVRKMSAMKSTYGGDISPSYTSNIASSVGLYVDTVVLPDPVLKTIMFTGSAKPDRLLYYSIKHALNTLSYRDLVLADVDPPIAVIVPDFVELDQSAHDLIQEAADADSLHHSSKLFGRTFASKDELRRFLRDLNGPRELVNNLKEPSRFVLDSEWNGSVEDQLRQFEEEIIQNFGRVPLGGGIPALLEMQVTGRMMQVNEVVLKAMSCGGTPLIDAPTSWQYLLWKYEYDLERSKEVGVNTADLLISKALQAKGKKEIKLLADLPSELLIELRRNGALSHFREILRAGVEQISSAPDATVGEVAEAVAININDALTKHELELDELTSAKKRFFGRDVMPWIAVGALSMITATHSSAPLSLALSILRLIGTRGGRDLVKELKEIRTKTQELKRSPIGFFFKHITPTKASIVDRYKPRR